MYRFCQWWHNSFRGYFLVILSLTDSIWGGDFIFLAVNYRLITILEVTVAGVKLSYYH